MTSRIDDDKKKMYRFREDINKSKRGTIITKAISMTSDQKFVFYAVKRTPLNIEDEKVNEVIQKLDEESEKQKKLESPYIITLYDNFVCEHVCYF